MGLAPQLTSASLVTFVTIASAQCACMISRASLASALLFLSQLLFLLVDLLKKRLGLFELEDHHADLCLVHVRRGLLEVRPELFVFEVLFGNLPCAEFSHEF